MNRVTPHTLKDIRQFSESPNCPPTIRDFLRSLFDEISLSGSVSLFFADPKKEFDDFPMLRLMQGEKVSVEAGEHMATIENDGEGMNLKVSKIDPNKQLSLLFEDSYKTDKPGLRP